MPIINHPTEFVGHCDDTGRLRCGLLTTLIDLQDTPLTGIREGALIHIRGSHGINVSYTASPAIITALEQGAQFWVGNLEGSEDAWLIDLT